MIEDYGVPSETIRRNFKPLVLLLLVPVMIVGATSLAVHISNKRDHMYKVFFDATNGKCYRTGVGAIGKVEDGDRLANSVILIFASGNRVKYPLETLRETSCSELMTTD